LHQGKLANDKSRLVLNQRHFFVRGVTIERSEIARFGEAEPSNKSKPMERRKWEMQDFGWLEGIFGSVRCSNCKEAYDRTDVNIAGNRDDYWFLRCVCHTCGTQGVGVVTLKRIELVLPSGSAVEEAFASTRCANCGAVYARSDLTPAGNRDNYWFNKIRLPYLRNASNWGGDREREGSRF